jgi:hypothetical protein
MNHTVNKMKRELYALIINELDRQARPSLKGKPHHEHDRIFREFVRSKYLVMGGPLNRELTPYFYDEVPENDHEQLVHADLDVLIVIATKLGYDLELSWTRK